MATIFDPTPKSKEELEALIYQQAYQIEQKEAQIEQLQTQVNWFMEQFRLSRERQYGKSSEKSEPAQQMNFFNDSEFIADQEPAPSQETVSISYTREKAKPGRKEIPPDVPVEEVEHRLPDDELICACCGGQRHEMSRKERFELKIYPPKVKMLKHIQYVYGCRRCEKEGTEVPIVAAPAPKPLIPKSFASPSSLAYVMTMKYVDGMPLYRQEQHFERMGIKLGRSVLSNWMLKGAGYLEMLYEVMKQALLERDVLAADETTVQVLKEPDRPAEAKSYMWLYRTGGGSDPPIVLFDYQTSRSPDHPKEFLNGFRGYLHVDGYVGYESLPGVILVGCWAHYPRCMIIRGDPAQAA
ncbi:MAG: IS66 family transposase [Candidatus Xenobiia bacterium LiM19]